MTPRKTHLDTLAVSLLLGCCLLWGFQQVLIKATLAEVPPLFHEVLEYTGAFMQLYREEGWYLERTVHYVGRVGLDHVKRRILDDAAGRRALWERLQFSLEGEPDPWFEATKAAVDTRQFTALAA